MTSNYILDRYAYPGSGNGYPPVTRAPQLGDPASSYFANDPTAGSALPVYIGTQRLQGMGDLTSSLTSGWFPILGLVASGLFLGMILHPRVQKARRRVKRIASQPVSLKQTLLIAGGGFAGGYLLAKGII